tara:strand:- start:239 stop:583 length:345 start_codon:yes stop_codon:yes gene_type:complete
MKNKIHSLCLKFRLYNIIYKGHFTIGKTIVGQHFIIGDYAPISLKRCIELERGYHQESYIEQEHDVQKAPFRPKILLGAAALGAAFATSCEKAIDDEKVTSVSPPAHRIDPPHS